MSICKACEFYVAETGSCGPLIRGRKLTEEERARLTVTKHRSKKRLCGCVVRLKTELYFSECPVGKWGMHNITRRQLEVIRQFCDTHITAGRMSSADVKLLYRYIEQVTGRKQQMSSCAPCVRTALESLRNGLKDKYQEGA